MSISAIGGAATAMPMQGMSGASGAGSSPRQKMSGLFDAIDSWGTGSITQAQFNQAFAERNPPAVFRNAGAQSIWSSLDPNNTGLVSRDNFVSTMAGLMASLRAQAPATSSSSGATSIGNSMAALQSIGVDGAPGSLLSLTA